jgi:hypothetical protein
MRWSNRQTSAIGEKIGRNGQESALQLNNGVQKAQDAIFSCAESRLSSLQSLSDGVSGQQLLNEAAERRDSRVRSARESQSMDLSVQNQHQARG